ncbi:restriction endonuclease subunit S [Runella salmonicolor]|uniref:Restriction endonuclease subunit S n=1 Tax=Runella salmonicolor TaxID=2950278 RepID=A0ABT1FQK9_9BACT|nr:restriction endonuclease subunit S [Runella salmonicolor]MCP1384061.1 restriction endonuclease subunit S [Runella salmonicolor]
MLAIQEEIDKASAYPAYKPSNIEWIGEIPKHWVKSKLKLQSKIVNGSTPSSTNEEFWDGDIIWVTPSDISKLSSCEIHDSIRKITIEGLNSCGTSLVPIKSIILTTRAPIGNIAIAETELCTNQGCKSIITKGESKFLYYYLKSFTEILESLGAGTTFKELSTETLKNLEFALPPLPEQQAIVTYLDQKTALIDELIGKKQRKIDLLKEQKTALINHAVTKGLNPDFSFKDSGIEWIGEIAEHWNKSKLKYKGSFFSGYSFDSNDFQSEGDIRVIKISNVQNNGISWEDLSYVPADFFEKFKDFRVLEGDLIFVLTRPIISTGIKVCFYNEDYLALLNQRNSVFRPHESSIIKKFLFYLVRTFYFIEEFKQQLKETNQPNISTEQISNINIFLPSLSEQQAIVSYLDEQTALIDTAIALEIQKIDKLKEYRQSLISAAVTGKICVLPFTEKREPKAV